MTSDFDYKKYSLEKLQEWVHDALSCEEASPHEIYSAIRELVQEDYQCYKEHAARAFGLLELLSGHRPVAEKDDGMRPWGHSDMEYLVKQNKVSSCDKDDKSPECQKAWNDFWEENYYPEEYAKAKVEANSAHNDGWTKEHYQKIVDKYESKQSKKWILPVEEVKDEDTDENVYCISFPDDLLEAANLKEGDLVEWVDNKDGSYRIEKMKISSWVEGNQLAKNKTYQEMVADGWSMTDDGFWIKE